MTAKKDDDEKKVQNKNGGKSDDKTEAKNQNDKHQNDKDSDDEIKVARTPTSPALLSRLWHRKFYRQARGLGAGGTGAAIWRVQRITALALIPLTLWFAVSMVRLSTAPHEAAAHWLARPVNAAIMVLFIVIALRHASIGLNIILEDYVDGEAMRIVAGLAVKTVTLILGVAAVTALIHLSL